MTDLDDAMLQRMIHIVYEEHTSFSHRNFLDLMKPKTFRNKISKLKKEGIVELDTKTPIAFYTLKGHRFGKAGTPNHTGVTISHNDPIYNMIKNVPMNAACIHAIQLKFKAPDLYENFSTNTPFPKFEGNKAIAIPSWIRNNSITKITINKNDTVTVIIGCSLDPIPLEYGGIIRFFTILASSEALLQGLNIMNHNYELVQNQSIPSYEKWIITRWDFGRDALVSYKGPKYEITVEKAQHIFVRIYVKDFARNKRLRAEIIQCPRKTVFDAIQEKLNL